MNDRKRLISVTTSCFNEEHNLHEFYGRLLGVFRQLPEYDYEVIIADNGSCDGSRDILHQIAMQDTRVKVIFNSNNFGVIRSGHHAFLQATGDAVIPMCSDLQDPPELILELVRAWEKGAHVVCAVKPQSRESMSMAAIRRFYYRLLSMISETSQIVNFTGFGLYDRAFMDAVRLYESPYPYFRGMVSEIGLHRVEVPFDQPARSGGRSKNNFLTLFDVAMTGFVNHSKLPLRLATFTGFCLAGLSLLVAIGYFVYKLLYWDSFQLGLSPLLIGMFFFSSVQLIFLGIVGEYVGSIHTQVQKRPLVVEKERINFD